jgi:hypothetical protein
MISGELSTSPILPEAALGGFTTLEDGAAAGGGSSVAILVRRLSEHSFPSTLAGQCSSSF